MFLQSAWLLGWAWSCVVPAVNADCSESEVCEYASSHQPLNIRHAALMQWKREHHALALLERGGGPSTVRLLLGEMEGLVHRKGIDGLDPEEVQHIQTIKALIADTIIPSILDGAEESRQEIAGLYEAMVNCSERAAGELDTESTLHSEVEKHRDDHKECREREDDIIKEKDRVCHQFNITRTSIELPAGEMPGLEVDDAAMIQYLKTMDEYFCGRMATFKDEWDECEDLKDNHTNTNNECVNHQRDLEETWCLWQSELAGTCGAYTECWNSTAARFYERKAAIEKLVEDQKEALQGAVMVQCLWDAWEWDREPCTVNETKVKECKDLQPNTSAVEVDIPSPPPPLPCDTSEDGYFPCTEAYIAYEYGSLRVSQALIDEMRDACAACPPIVPKEDDLVPPDSLILHNLKHVEASTYEVTFVCGGWAKSPWSDIRLIELVRYSGHGNMVVDLSADVDGEEVKQMLRVGPTHFYLTGFDPYYIQTTVADGDLVTIDLTGETVIVSLRDQTVGSARNHFLATGASVKVTYDGMEGTLFDVKLKRG